MLFQFTRPFLFIYSFIIINYYFLVEKKLQNTEKDSKPSLYKTLMGDIISHLKKSKQYFVCTMGLKAYSFVLTHKTVFRMVRL